MIQRVNKTSRPHLTLVSSSRRLVVFLIFLFILFFSSFNSARAQLAVYEEHSPDVALRWSLIPGAGQIYNGQAWKVPIIYGAFAGMGYLIYDNYKNMKMFKDEYLYRRNNFDQRQLEDYASYPTENIYNLYNDYNKNFQLMIIITAGIYALNLVDAYVFGHLYGFQIDDNLTLNIAPTIGYTPLGPSPSLTVGLHF